MPGMLRTWNLGHANERGNYRYRDGSKIWKHPNGKWFGTWADGTPLRGCSEKTGFEIDWPFDTPEEVAEALLMNNEGPVEFNPRHPVTRFFPATIVKDDIPTSFGSVKGDSSDFEGNWHHGAGFLCWGTVRVARADFDTNPSDEFQQEMFDWIVKTLNGKRDR